MFENSSLLDELKEYVIQQNDDLGDLTLIISRENLPIVVKALKLNFGFNLLLDITAVDKIEEDIRFEVVYHFRNLQTFQLLRLKILLNENDVKVPSIFEFYNSANFLERETWDMYGIVFEGHPDLRRILMYPEFTGHPLRKDYPIQGKQPRVKLIAPEVQNTARLMNRQELVSINSKGKL